MNLSHTPRAMRGCAVASPKITQLPYNWSNSRGKQPIVAIVAHGTVGTDSRAYLSRGGDLPDGSDRKVSIHALIQKDGTIYRYVPDHLGANHAGFGTMPAPWQNIPVNQCTLGFELENLQNGKDPYTDTQLLAMGWLINDWRRQHGALALLRHADIDPTRRADPVSLSVADMERWCVRAIDYYDADPFAEWGDIERPEGVARQFGIPQTWLKNKAALGRCLRGERYDLAGQISRAMFEGGELRYFAPTNVVEVLKYPKRLT
jgi:N-acetyl-anhydromuramyl-L-alanine amidase AmpD